MHTSNSLAIKKYINMSIFIGVIAAAIAFVFAISQPQQYLVVGKLVVFPAGSALVEKNLGYEIGNTVQIINSPAFQENTFQGNAGNFAYAKQIGNSSVIKIAFYTPKDNEMMIDDAIVRIPDAVAAYARDLYDGSPFKYRLLGDPEISVGPAKPNLAQYLGTGFVVGILLYFAYWFLFVFLRIPTEPSTPESMPEKKTGMKPSEQKPKPKKSAEADIKKEKAEQPAPTVGRGKVVMENGRPAFIPGEKQEAASSAPENLPFVDESVPPSEIQEPSDEEVKERLNRLMRGEL